jgi:hypothetical protein
MILVSAAKFRGISLEKYLAAALCTTHNYSIPFDNHVLLPIYEMIIYDGDILQFDTNRSVQTSIVRDISSVVLIARQNCHCFIVNSSNMIRIIAV